MASPPDPSPTDMATNHCCSPTKIAIAVVERDGCFLIGQRPAGAPLAGLWEFPGGKLEPGETLEQAAIRECQEEAGVEVKVLRKRLTIMHQYDHGTLELHFFACRQCDPGQTPGPRFRWVYATCLEEYAFPPANDALLEELRRSTIANPSPFGPAHIKGTSE